MSPQGQLELGAKLRLEATFRRELRQFFNRILTDFRTALAVSGRAVNARQYTPAITSALQVHYRRSQDRFKGVVADSQGGKAWRLFELKQTPEEEENLEELILLALLAWRNEAAPRKAGFISTTNELQMQQAIESARAQLIQQGEGITNRNLAAVATTILRRLYDTRIERIIITETQEVAESTKLIEAQGMAGLVPFTAIGLPGATPAVPVVRTATKTWNDQDDERVRATHRVVGGTTLALNGVFRVGTSMLLFPGDTSLRAQVREVANCRCFLTYGFGGG